MNQLTKILFFLFTICLSICSCKSAEPVIASESSFDGNKIRGFTQFQIYRGSDLLGYIPSDKGDNYNFRVWEGKIKKDSIQQNIKIDYNKETAFEFSASLKALFNVSAGINDIKKIHLTLINPVEYILENPYPALQYAGRKDFLSTQYIGSILKVDKIKIELLIKDGTYLSGDSIVKYLSPGAKFKIDTTEKATFFAENAFIGYKLFSPPQNAASLTPFEFVYQFLHNESGSKGWKLISERGEIKNKDALQIRVQASHSSYVYIFNIDSKGNVGLLFPDPKIGDNPIKGGKMYNFPEKLNQGFQVDTNKGVEEFLFMVFREEKPEMKEIVERARKGEYKVEQFRNSSVIQKTNDVKTKGVGGITEIKISDNETTPGFDFKTKKIQGLPADFKETFILMHK